MVWLHNMMEQTEGPANQPMIDQFADLKEAAAAADATYVKDMKAAMKSFKKTAQ
jgi:hypothetical protein